jgi:hypothetical protein
MAQGRLAKQLLEKLRLLATSYLYRDVLNYNRIKNPDLLMKILKALALQVGSEVSPNEIARSIQIDRKTILSYLSLLEQAFVIFKLPPYLVSERRKFNEYHGFSPNSYFWRTHSGNEIDLVEEINGEFAPFEFKYSSEKFARGANSFVETYNSKEIRVVNKNNVIEWLG